MLWLVGIVATHEISPVVAIIQNRSDEPVTIRASLGGGPEIWGGRLKPGGTATGAARILGDTHFVVRCRKLTGSERTVKYGYLTNGMDARITVTVQSCDDIDIDQENLLF
jgi:hypothetical protein